MLLYIYIYIYIYINSVYNVLFTDSRTIFLQIVLPWFCWTVLIHARTRTHTHNIYINSVYNVLFTDRRTTFLQIVLHWFCWEWEQHMYDFCNIINFLERGKYLISFHVSSVISVDSRVSSSRDLIVFCFVLVESNGINFPLLFPVNLPSVLYSWRQGQYFPRYT